MTNTDSPPTPEKRGRGRPKTSSDSQRREDGAARQRAHRLKKSREAAIQAAVLKGVTSTDRTLGDKAAWLMLLEEAGDGDRFFFEFADGKEGRGKKAEVRELLASGQTLFRLQYAGR